MAVVAACSSSSSGGGATNTGSDGGDDATSVGSDDSSTSNSCIPLGKPTCASGTTCCFDITTFSGACVAPSACTKNIQVQCAGNSCGTGSKCCANFGGISLAQVEDAGLGALGIDASAINPEAGISGIAAGLGGLMVNVSCAATCPANTVQECSSSADCDSGWTCEALSALAGDAGIDASAAASSGFGSELSSLTSTMVCVPPDGGVGTPPDSGTQTGDDSGVDSGTTVVDAGVDAADAQ